MTLKDTYTAKQSMANMQCRFNMVKPTNDLDNSISTSKDTSESNCISDSLSQYSTAVVVINMTCDMSSLIARLRQR